MEGVCSLHPPKEEKAPQRDPPDEKEGCSYPLGDSELTGGLYLLLCPQLAGTDPSACAQAVRSAIPGAKGFTPWREVKKVGGPALRKR